MKETGLTGKRRSTTIAATPDDGNSQRKRRRMLAPPGGYCYHHMEQIHNEVYGMSFQFLAIVELQESNVVPIEI